MVFSTSHVPTVHPIVAPIVAAKQCVTVDHISNGRFGLNLVMGWFTPEIEMFGVPQREQDERYAFGAEWLGIVKRLWTEEAPFDLEGKYFRISQGQAHPKPLQKPYPVRVNAGNSPAGLEFSAREVDFNFFTLDTIEHGREVIADLASACARIRAENRRDDLCDDDPPRYRARGAGGPARDPGQGRLGAATNIMKVLGMESGSFQEQIRSFGERFILGWGGYPLVGTPEQAVDQLKTISAMGIEGVILGFLDYHEELAYFERAVMPQAGGIAALTVGAAA